VRILPEILNNLNWLDIIFVILFLGMVYKGTRTGVGGQILSLIGWVVLIFISLKYYVFVSEAFFGFLLQRWAKPISFLVIGLLVFVIVKFVERIFSVVSGSDLSALEKLGGAIVAAIKAFVFFGAIGILILLIPLDYARYSAMDASRSCMFFVGFDAGIYSMITEMIGIDHQKQSKDQVVENILSVTEPETNKK
jgi:hypothetical protein